MKYCPTCDATRDETQLQDGHCVVCGTEVVERSAAAPARRPLDEMQVIRPPERLVHRREENPETPEPRTVVPPLPPSPASPPGPAGPAGTAGPAAPAAETVPFRRDPDLTQAVRSRPAGGAPSVTRAVPRSERREPGPSESERRESDEIDYARLVSEVGERIGAGYEAFGLVGHPSSGKTHFLKALTYLLDRHAVGGQRASVEFHRAEVPGATAASVFDYAYTGPAGERWIFLDAGGELYVRLRDNDWSAPDVSVRLTEWLRHCKGLFCFLHLQRGHFGAPALDVDPTIGDDAARRRRIEEEQRKAREAKQELDFFKHFLLFLRALRAADRDHQGGAAEIVERCRRAGSLEEALRGYHRTAPLLDVPVMFFFTQADAYLHGGFELRPGLHLDPRRLPLPASVFAARYLPSLFGGVASQARRFKFDFLQSYEEHVLGHRDERGEPVAETWFHAPDDPELLLSAGLAPALDFVLANRPAAGRRSGVRGWLPELDTRRALRLHRRFHPKLWRGVPANLLDGKLPKERREPTSTAEPAEEIEPAGEPPA
jgi:hypothetical protein